MVVVIKNYEGTFPGGQILSVRPADPDTTGQYRCRLLKGPENIFTVEPGCAVRAGRIHNGREYELRVTTNDGKHADVEVQARLNFVGFSQFAVQESVVVRFPPNVTPFQVSFNLQDIDNLMNQKLASMS